MAKNPAVAIIITTFNNERYIEYCLAGVKRQSYKNYECIVVDDCSNDKTVKLIKKSMPSAKIIVKSKNTGPSISRNMGIRTTRAKYIVTLDSDAVLEKDWLKNQMRFLEKNPSFGIAGSKLLYKSNKSIVNSAGGAITTSGIGFDVGSHEKVSDKKFSRPKEYAYVCSAAMIVRHEVFDKIGMFDETYFYGHEDTDLGWRANIAGWKVMYNPKAVAYHDVSETMQHYSSRVYYYATKNRFRSLLKNYEWYNVVRYGSLLLTLTLGDILLRTHKIVKLRALFWNMFHLVEILKERKKVQATRKLHDCQLAKLFVSSKVLFTKG